AGQDLAKQALQEIVILPALRPEVRGVNFSHTGSEVTLACLCACMCVFVCVCVCACVCACVCVCLYMKDRNTKNFFFNEEFCVKDYTIVPANTLYAYMYS